MSNLIAKIKTLQDTYHEQGMKSATSKIIDYFITGSGAVYTKKVLRKQLYLKLYTYYRLGYWPQIKNPRTFNEKIQHRKLYTSNELFSIVEDKWRVREYVAKKIDNDILPEVYHVTEEPETIPFSDLPNEYVIKPTHMSGPIIFVDKYERPDRSSIIHSCHKWLNITYGELKEEYWYSEINPQIIVEEKLVDEDDGVPPDFKFFVFHGNVEYIEVDMDRYENHRRRFYDRDWNPMEFELKFPLAPTMERPSKLNEMIDIAEQLGQDFDFIRVDLYEVNDDRVVFGEITVAHGSGGEQFKPVKYDYEFGTNW